jgi:hypothetical protein
VTALVGLAALPNQSRADQENFVFDSANDTTALGPGPYGTLNVNRIDSTHATLTFTANPGFFVQSGNAGAGANANGAAQISSWFGGLSGDFSGNVSDRGTFNHVATVDNTNPTVVGFTLQAINGNTWATVANVLIANNLGNFAEMHLNQINGPNPSTGFVSTSGPQVVPEFSSAVLMLVLMASFAGIIGWNRLRAPAVD